MKVCFFCGHRFQMEGWDCPVCGESPEWYQGYPVFAPDIIKGHDSYAEYGYQELFEIEAGHFWFTSRNRLLIWALHSYFPKATSFLEIGCGTGFVSSEVKQEFPEMVLSASDTLIEGLIYAEKRLARVTLFQMDAQNIPFETEFDVIGAFDVLEHIQEDEVVLSEMFRAVKQGGGILLTVPQHPSLWSLLDDFGHHKRRYTRSDLIKKVKHAGFEIIFTTSFVSFLLPVLFLSRMRQRKLQDNCDVMSEFKISPFLNSFLEKVLDFEQLFIKRGVSFPVGGSLLLVARKNRG